jgi:hypothetical protein
MSDESIKLCRVLALCAACGVVFALAPPYGIAAVSLAALLVENGRRLEFISLFALVAVFPLLGVLSYVIVEKPFGGGPILFIALAVLRDFFGWFRPDPAPYESDAGPSLTPTEWQIVMVCGLAVGPIAAATYAYLRHKRSTASSRSAAELSHPPEPAQPR